MSQHHFHRNKNFQNFSDYSVIDIINYGSFGTCYKVKRKSLNRLYVWKAIDFGAMSNHDKQVNLLVTFSFFEFVLTLNLAIHFILGIASRYQDER